jgi:hypothetical protein
MANANSVQASQAGQARGRQMKQAKMPGDPNRRAKATVDIIDAILDR